MYHHAPRPGAPADCALLRIWPHEGAVGSPSPMNASVVSVNTAVANVNTDWATMRFTTLGRMWRRMIRPEPDPMTRARSTNIRSLSDSTWLRMTRAVVAQLVRPMTIDDHDQRRADPEQLGLGPDDVEHDRGQDQRQHDRRQHEEEVGQAHQQVVDGAACEPGHDTDQRADDDRDQRGHEADRHRDPRPVDRHVQHVAAELVGAEPVLRARRLRGAGRSRSSASRNGPTNSAGTIASTENTARIVDPDEAVGPAEQPAP